MTDTPPAKIEPCPFCGSNTDWHAEDIPLKKYVRCNNPVCFMHKAMGTRVPVETWNHRIAAHAPKASLSAIFECIGGEDNIGVILPEQLKRLTLNVIMPLLLEPGRLGELALILNRLVLTAEAHAPKQPELEAKEKALREALITCVQELHNPQGYEHRRAIIDNAEAILSREQEKQP